MERGRSEMSGSQIQSADSAPFEFPSWLQTFGYLVVPPTFLVIAWKVWEETVASWEHGPQIGISAFIHVGGFLLLAPIALGFVIWASCALGMASLVTIRRRRIAGKSLALILPALIATLAYLPSDGFWQRAFVSRLSPEAAVEFLTYYAGRGDLATVRALVEHGVDVNADNRHFSTALHVAAGSGQIEIMDYLIAHGANVNAASMTVATPLDYANDATSNRKEAESVLIAHGGKSGKASEASKSQASNANGN
jgi:hypothetical protein